MRLMWTRLWFLCAGLLVGWAGLMYVPGYAQTPCADELAMAENQYLEGRFDDAIRQLQTCLDQASLTADAAVPVYRLLSLAFIQRGDLNQARLAIINLLGVAPEYEADPIQDPPSYATLVDQVREAVQVEREPEPTPPQEPPPAQVEEQPAADVPPTPAVPSDERPRDDRWWLSGVKNVLVTAGGAVVMVVAAALAFGG